MVLSESYRKRLQELAGLIKESEQDGTMNFGEFPAGIPFSPLNYSVMAEEEENKQKISKLDGEVYYHQTDCRNVDSIMKNGFHVDLTIGQARYTHGIYFLNHPEGSYGACTLQAKIYGHFLDFRDENDVLGDAWVAFKGSYQWNNYLELTEKVRAGNPNIDGLLFDRMVVVWYPEKSIKEVKILK